MSLSGSTLLGRPKLSDLLKVLLPLVVLFAAMPDTVLLSSFAFGLLVPLCPVFALLNGVSVLFDGSLGKTISLICSRLTGVEVVEEEAS